MCIKSFFSRKEKTEEKEPNQNHFVSEIIFNNNSKLVLNDGDIVVFVGANNVGKSQALNDLYRNLYTYEKGIILNSIKINKEKIKEFFDKNFKTIRDRHQRLVYNVPMSNGISDNEIEIYNKNSSYGLCREAFVANINTESRLSICKPIDILDDHEIATAPQQLLTTDNNRKETLSNKFFRAFKKRIFLNYYNSKKIKLCMGDDIVIEGDVCEQTIDSFAKKLDNYKLISEQGDGIKSFAGILLFLALDFYRIFLIDEPEAFLHPPQAQIMGNIIGESIKNDQQAFISTHSENFLKGLLDTCPNRVKIVRISRIDDKNDFAILNNEDLKTVWNDSLLRHSNILQGLFYKTVILCESDSDCKMYSIIDKFLKEKNGILPETMFIHCGGKSRLSKVIPIFKALKVNLRIITDIDILDDRKNFASFAQSIGIEWSDLKEDWLTISDSISNIYKSVKRLTIKEMVKCGEPDLSQNEISDLKKLLDTECGWSQIKKGGFKMLGNAKAQDAFITINKKLNEKGAFIVPAGELESLIIGCQGHGPTWVNAVLEKYPNLEDNIYEEIKKFVQSWNI